MTELSLNDIMNRMADQAHRIKIIDAPPHGEEDAFIKADPIFASLHKSYRNACAQLKRLQRKHGHDDPMTDIATDMVDSALSALQTRAIEVRACAETMLKARKYIQQAILEAEKERRMQSTLYKARMFAFYQTEWQSNYKDRKKAERERFLIFVVWLFIFAMEQAQRSFSLSNDFIGAQFKDGKQAA